jgi:hypothetical protein
MRLDITVATWSWHLAVAISCLRLRPGREAVNGKRAPQRAPPERGHSCPQQYWLVNALGHWPGRVAFRRRLRTGMSARRNSPAPGTRRQAGEIGPATGRNGGG